MKINDITQPQQLKPSSPGTSPAPGGSDFRTILENKIHHLAESQKTSGTTSTESPVSISPSLRIEGLSITESTINSLEAFSLALGNLQTKTEELDPFVTDIEEKLSALLDIKNQLPANDPLATLLERVTTSAYLETAKYRRGDYNA